MSQCQLRLVHSTSHQTPSSTTLARNCSGSVKTSSTSTASSSRPPRSLGDKLQLLALSRPGIVKGIERIVDRVLELEQMKPSR